MKLHYSNPSCDRDDFQDDCFIRALANAYDADYRMTWLSVALYSYQINQFSLDSKALVYAYLAAKLRRRIKWPMKRNQTVSNLAFNLGDKGTFIVIMNNHVSCIKDGVLWDTWDCSRKLVEAYCRVDTEY